MGAGFVATWISRERIAGNIIQEELDRLGLPATYEIVSITPQKQLLRNLIVGNPNRPDLLIEEVVVNLEYGLAGPAVGQIEIVKPRLYATFRGGEFSLGSLDPVLFSDSEEPPALPQFDVVLRDGRALVESDFGAVGAKFTGSGRLDDGFNGKLAITAPNAGVAGCNVETATAYGDVTTKDGVPSFVGPLRLRGLDCQGGTLKTFDASADLALTQDLSGAGGTVTLAADALDFANGGAAMLSGDVVFSWDEGGLNLRHDLLADQIRTDYGNFDEARLDGAFRSEPGFARSDWDANVTGRGLNLAGGANAMIEEAKAGSAETLLAPLIAKFQRNFTQASSDANLAAAFTLRQTEDATTFVIPEGRLQSGSGETLLALSRVSWIRSDAGARLSGNFVTGGRGLPRVNGRMEQSRGGSLALRIAMAEFAQGSDRISIPRLQVTQRQDGNVTFGGAAVVGGAIPGGSITALEIPIEGEWNNTSGLILGRQCLDLRFGGLNVYDLAIEGSAISVCPEQGAPMIRFTDTLTVNAAARDVQFTGVLAGSPTELSAGAIAIAYPGSFALQDARVVLGAEESSMQLHSSSIEGNFDTLGGTFSGANAALDFVPLDLSEASGLWAYRDNALVIEDGAFELSERIEGEARFEPLTGRAAMMSLLGNELKAHADLTHSGSGRLITRINLIHDLGQGIGVATIDVPGVIFDDRLRPEDLSNLVKGVIANANGTVSGEGRIRWSEDSITSEGTFGTEELDLAAAFGPIDGLRGEIRFTDLINLTTAPAQTLEIGSMNPGIEVLAGRVQYSLTNGELISVEDARWPFMGGELILRPVDIRYGTPGSQLYVLEIVGLDAETFIAQMELSNLSATGTFDGAVPILFDDQGNGTIGAGLLLSRAPGGNVSYIGELTYEDMGAITNFAFQSLKSLDYTQMSIGLDGSLAGEIITSFKIDGVRQGAGANQNLFTRQLSKLPIRFNVNVRSENFYQLATMVQSFFDPDYLGNPVDRGLFDVEGQRFSPANPFVEPQPSAPGPSENVQDTPALNLRRGDETPVQPVESDEDL
ncbi:intermembrane phospholipid transport protein YdbH family protein [Erythrobacter insulae]|nr:YdbH domain-containing protein [Erythrobacter insulae]